MRVTGTNKERRTILSKANLARVLAAALIAGAYGCGGDDKSKDDAAAPSAATMSSTVKTVAPEPTNEDAVPDAEDTENTEDIETVTGPFEKGGLQAAADAVKDELGHSPEVLEVTVSEDRAQFQVRDKNKPKNVDGYVWQGGALSDPIPVQLSGSGSLKENVFPMSSVDFGVVPKLIKAANKVDIEGREISTILLGRSIITGAIQWSVNISGTRESKQLRANAQGKVTEIV